MDAPVTALYAGLCGLLMLALALNVVRGRVTHKVGFGDGGVASLIQRQRVHGNAVEYVPTALVLLLVLELNGASTTVLHGIGGTLFASRVLHAWGLSSSTGTTVGRFAGTMGTWLVLLAGGALCLLTFFG